MTEEEAVMQLNDEENQFLVFEMPKMKGFGDLQTQRRKLWFNSALIEKSRENYTIQKLPLPNLSKNLRLKLQIEILSGKKRFSGKTQDNIRHEFKNLDLAFAGFAHYIHAGRIQIVGQSEISLSLQLEAKTNQRLSKISTLTKSLYFNNKKS